MRMVDTGKGTVMRDRDDTSLATNIFEMIIERSWQNLATKAAQKLDLMLWRSRS